MNILFTCAGRRNYLINYFKEALGGKGKVIAADNQASAPAMVDADISVTVPGIYEPDYIEALEAIANTYRLSAIISLNDLELPVLAENKARLEQTGARVLISDSHSIDIAFDKWKTIQFANEIGLHTPKSYLNPQEVISDIREGKLNFPLVVKPRWGSASIGIEFPESEEEFLLTMELQKHKLQRSILKNASEKDVEEAIIIQEKIQGVEIGLDILNDFERNYYGTFAREKLTMRSGETDKARSIIDPEIEKLGAKIGSSLGHIGNMDCDIFIKDQKLYLLELNPRFGGGYPFSHEAGINTASIYISWLRGDMDIARFNKYKAGLEFSKCDRLIPITDGSAMDWKQLSKI